MNKEILNILNIQLAKYQNECHIDNIDKIIAQGKIKAIKETLAIFNTMKNISIRTKKRQNY
jgi:soluble cytochrome b562